MATPLTVVRASLNAILVAVQAQLVAKTNIPATLIHVVQKGKRVPQFDGTPDVLLKMGGFTTVQGHRDRLDCRIKRTLNIIIRTPLAPYDEYYDDDAGTQNAYGVPNQAAIVIEEESFLSAMISFDPQDGNGNSLCYEPVELLGGDDYERDSVSTLIWNEVKLRFGLAIELPLDQSWY